MKLYKDKSYNNNLGYIFKISRCRVKQPVLINCLLFTLKIKIRECL
jgi:hypothetical protein